MGKISELRAKVKDGTATEQEKAELEELEAEAAAPTEDAPATEEESTEEEEGKSIVELGKKLADVALAELKKSMASDAKKGDITPSKTEKADMPTGKEKVKQFFTALFDNDRTKLDHLSEGTNADGGFLVPQEYNDTFVEDRRDAVIMRAAGATQINVTSNTFNIPQLAARPRMYWTNELAVKTSTSAQWSNQTLTPYVLAAIMTVSNQVIADAKIGGNIIDVVTRLMTRAIAEFEDRAFFTGSGTGQPTGLNTYTVSQVNATTGLTGDMLINAMYALGQGYRNQAAWFMNARTIRIVRQLKDSQNRYLFVDALTATSFPTLLGRPVYEQNDLPSSQIWFGDVSAYWIADSDGISVMVSDVATVSGQSAFERNFTAVRVEERTDGELTVARAFVEIVNVPSS